MSRYPYPLNQLPHDAASELLGMGGAAPVKGFTRTALPDQYPSRSACFAIGSAGTYILVGTVSSIGTDKGTIQRNWDGTTGVISRYNSTTQLEVIVRRVGAANWSLTHNISGLNGMRKWLTWDDDGSGGTDVELGRGNPDTTGSSSPGNIGAGILTGTPTGSDCSALDQDGSANRALTGTGLLPLYFSSKLSYAEINGPLAALLAHPDLIDCPHPDQDIGANVTSITGDSGTWTPTNSTTTGTHNPMTVAEVTG